MKVLTRRFSQHPKLVVEIALATVLYNVLALATPLFIIQVINRYVSFGFDGTLWTLTVGVCIAALAAMGVSWARSRMVMMVESEPNRDMYDELYNALALTRVGAIEQMSKARLQELVGSVGRISGGLNSSTVTAFLDAPLLLLCLGLVFMLSPVLGAVTLVAVIAAILLGLWGIVGDTDHEEDLRGKEVGRQGQIGTLIHDHDTPRAFSAYRYFDKFWKKQVHDTFSQKDRQSSAGQRTQLLLQNVSVFLRIFIYAFGAIQVVHGGLEVGVLIGAGILSGKAVQIASSFTRGFRAYTLAQRDQKELEKLLAMPRERLNGAAVQNYEGCIELQDVAFAYPGTTTPLFESLNFSLPSGSLCVVMGPNGSGKSTLLRLLLGLLEPSRGDILVDTVNLRQASLLWWRSQVIYLPQEPQFMHASVRDNIMTACPDMNAKKLNKVIELAGLHDFIRSSSMGLDTPIVNGGRNLALGIRKRLAMARALATDGKLVVLDEPLEGLDIAGREHVLRLIKLMHDKGKTIMVVSQHPDVQNLATYCVDLTPKPVPKIMAKPTAKPAACPKPSIIHIDTTNPEPPWKTEGKNSLRGVRIFALTSLFAFIGFIVWASAFSLDIVSQAPGEVIPYGRVKRVEHLEGGIVRKIEVREGAEVIKGQPLVELESTSSGASVEELTVRMTALQVLIARLEAEQNGDSSIAFDPKLRKQSPSMVQEAETLFMHRLKKLKSATRGQEQKIQQRKQDINQISARINKNKENLALSLEQVKVSDQLLAKKLTTRYEHTALLKERNRLSGLLKEDAAAKSRAIAALGESRQRLNQIRDKYHSEVSENLGRAKREREEMEQQMRKVDDRLKRTVIRSPVNGIVKAVRLVSIGEVISPGETIMEIVPTQDRLIVEAHLPITDIGYVRAGQKAVIKLSGRESSRFGKIDGVVSHVSPDAFAEQRGLPYYRVQVETSKSSFTKQGHSYRLFPGMHVSVGIFTGQRTVLAYFMEHYVGSMDGALQER